MKEEQIQQKYMEYQFLAQHMQQMSQQITQIKAHIQELETLKEDLNELDKTKNEEEILVPIGSGIFKKARLLKENNVIMNVGADVMVTKTVEDAKNVIDEQLEELNTFILNMDNQLSLLSSNLQILQEEISKSQ